MGLLHMAINVPYWQSHAYFHSLSGSGPDPAPALSYCYILLNLTKNVYSSIGPCPHHVVLPSHVAYTSLADGRHHATTYIDFILYISVPLVSPAAYHPCPWSTVAT